MPRAIADFSVGHSAVGSVAETIRTLAPFAIAAWIAGSCDADVAAEPLVSVPVSPSVFSAAIAPPRLHAVGHREVVVAEVLRDHEHLQPRLQRPARARGTGRARRCGRTRRAARGRGAAGRATACGEAHHRGRQGDRLAQRTTDTPPLRTATTDLLHTTTPVFVLAGHRASSAPPVRARMCSIRAKPRSARTNTVAPSEQNDQSRSNQTTFAHVKGAGRDGRPSSRRHGGPGKP